MQNSGALVLGLIIRSGLMVNMLLLNHKTIGSAALRCGASSFGFKDMGRFARYPSLFVAIFKDISKRDKFLRFLRSQNLKFDKNFDYRFRMYHNEFIYLVYVKFYLFIPGEKIAFKNFRQLCNSKEVQVYTNRFYQHPNKSKRSFNNG